MPDYRLYAWVGRSPDGMEISGEREAPSQAGLAWLLAQEGIKLIRAVPRSMTTGRSRIRTRDKVQMLRQWATLIQAGVPVLQALEATRKGVENLPLQALIADLEARLQGGQTLADAMAAHPQNFDVLTRRMVAAGELAGSLDVMLGRVADHQERMRVMRDKVRTALLYPATILVLTMLLTLALLVFVVPTFSGMYAQSKLALPIPTQIVMMASNLVVAYAAHLLLIALLIGGMLMRAWPRSPALREQVEAMALRLPVMGGILAKAALARWARTFASLFAAGIPLAQTLNAAAGASGSRRLHRVLNGIRTDIAAGFSLAYALKNTGAYPPMVVQMTAVGEESGTLEGMLSKVADYYEHEMNESIARLSSLMEPIIMVLIGILVGGVVIALYLPIFNLGRVL